MKWRKGDMGFVKHSTICDPQWSEKYRGEQCELIRRIFFGKYDWKIQFSNGERADISETALRKDYDGHEPCTWESCIWEPDLVGVEITELI
jgi:hypothetical protein